MSYDKVFGSFPGELKIGTVTSIEENKDPLVSKGGFVVIDGSEKVMYDVLIVATGSCWLGHLAFPNDEEAFKEHISSWREKIKTSQNIVIAGGGAVGIGERLRLVPPSMFSEKLFLQKSRGRSKIHSR